MANRNGKKKKLRLKKSVRRTIATLLMITAIIVAAIPAPKLKAASGMEYKPDGKDYILIFDEDNGEATITGYKPNPNRVDSYSKISTITIPVQVQNSNSDDGRTYDVTAISRIDCNENGDRSSLTTVEFESGSKVKRIGNGAFSNNTGLNSIELPDSVETIGDEAFVGCSSLVGTIRIPENVKTIGSNCYADLGCDSVNILSTQLSEIKSGAFSGCASLGSVSFPSGDYAIAFGDQVFMDSGLQNINLPTGLTRMGREVFSGCTNLSSLDFSNLTNLGGTIGINAFYNCEKLQITGLDKTKITAVDSGAFMKCEALSSISLPGRKGSEYSGCTSIASDAFSGCKKLRDIHLPGSITSIADGTFTDCGTGNAQFTLRVDNFDGTVTPKNPSEFPDGKAGT